VDKSEKRLKSGFIYDCLEDKRHENMSIVGRKKKELLELLYSSKKQNF